MPRCTLIQRTHAVPRRFIRADATLHRHYARRVMLHVPTRGVCVGFASLPLDICVDAMLALAGVEIHSFFAWAACDVSDPRPATRRSDCLSEHKPTLGSLLACGTIDQNVVACSTFHVVVEEEDATMCSVASATEMSTLDCDDINCAVAERGHAIREFVMTMCRAAAASLAMSSIDTDTVPVVKRQTTALVHAPFALDVHPLFAQISTHLRNLDWDTSYGENDDQAEMQRCGAAWLGKRHRECE